MPFPELPPLSHRTRQRLAGWTCVLSYAWALAAPLAHAGFVLPLEGTGRYSQRDVLGRIITTAYDALNRPLTITDNNGTVSTTADDQVTHYGYDLAGRALRLEEKSAGQTVNWTVNTHDLLGRLKTRTLHAGAAALATFSWEHDALGRVEEQHEEWAASAASTARTRTTTMSYDAAGRLHVESIAESGEPVVSTTYTYDDSHNRTGKLITGGAEAGNTVCVFNAANQLTSMSKTSSTGAPAEAVTYVYDPYGNRSSSSRVVGGGAVQVTTYRWNGWDKLMGVQMPDGKAYTYAYDYRSRRVGVAQDDTGGLPARLTNVVFSGGLSVAEFESSWYQTISSGTQPSVQYIRGPDMGGGVGGLLRTVRNPVSATTGLPVAATTNDPATLKYNLSNGRGDVVAQSDSTGALTWTASYEAYGKRTKETGTNQDKQRANTKDEDPTGLLNEGFRYRDIETGVWLSRDPAGFVDGPNLYAYVQQNPWTKFDPEGLFWGMFFGQPTIPNPNLFIRIEGGGATGALARPLIRGGIEAGEFGGRGGLEYAPPTSAAAVPKPSVAPAATPKPAPATNFRPAVDSALMPAPETAASPTSSSQDAQRNNRQILYINDIFDSGSAESTQLSDFVGRWNQEVSKNGGSMTTRRPSLQDQVTKKAAQRAERNNNPGSYPAGRSDIVAGHIPDVIAGGNPIGPFMPLDRRVNSSVGSQVQKIHSNSVARTGGGFTYNEVRIIPKPKSSPKSSGAGDV